MFQLRGALRRSIPSRAGGGIGTGHDCGAQGFYILLGHRTRGPVRAVSTAKADQIGDAVDQHRGFAAACTSQDQQRAFGGKHRTALHIVQPAKLFFNIGIPQRAEFLFQSPCHICCRLLPFYNIQSNI